MPDFEWGQNLRLRGNVWVVFDFRHMVWISKVKKGVGFLPLAGLGFLRIEPEVGRVKRG
jgi:hypothetical protein